VNGRTGSDPTVLAGRSGDGQETGAGPRALKRESPSVVGLDGIDNIAEHIADTWSQQRKDNDHDDRDQSNDQRILEQALAPVKRLRE
jgi:hypothetical protein